MEIDSGLFFNLVDQFKKAKDEITALSTQLSVNNNSTTYALCNQEKTYLKQQRLQIRWR